MPHKQLEYSCPLPSQYGNRSGKDRPSSTNIVRLFSFAPFWTLEQYEDHYNLLKLGPKTMSKEMGI
jgi:hypothetical protein